MLLALLTFAATSAVAAEPIFVPDFTCDRSEDFQVTVMLDGQVKERLLAEGHVVLSSAVVAPVTGAAAVTNCALTPGCPADILPRIPATLAIVARVSRSGTTLVGHIEVYRRGDDRPVDAREVPIAPGSEHVFAHEVALAATVALESIPPASQAELVAAARLIAGMGEAAPDETDVREDAPVAPVVIEDIDDTTAAQRGQAVRDLYKLPPGVHKRHLVGARKNYEKAGIDARDWLYREMPHGGRVAVDVRVGLGLGDIDRVADSRVELRGTTITSEWYQDAPNQARRVKGGLFLGYAPSAWCDAGVVLSLQYSGRIITTGYAKIDELGALVDDQVSPPGKTQAVSFEIEPRFRVFVVPTGPAKPFLYAGPAFRYFSPYHIEQPPQFAYPNPPGAWVPGAGGGGGLMIDPSPLLGIYFEGGYTGHFGARADPVEAGQWTYPKPSLPVPTHGTATVLGGVQFRL
jgi:hypothetical protein